jgi:PLP dependent protein
LKDLESLEANLLAIRKRLAAASLAANRPQNEVQLIAVTKKQTAVTVRAAYALGLRDFGENYAQEFFEKQRELSDLTDIRWHFIGHLQTNKTKQVYPFVFSLQSLNRPSLLKVILEQKAPNVKVFLQLSVDPTDAGKTSLDPNLENDICAQLGEAHKNGNLKWAGFMGIGPAGTDKETTLVLFEKWRQRAQDLWADFHPDSESVAPQFSLGMSNDLEEAVKAGSNFVRVGTALFGERT